MLMSGHEGEVYCCKFHPNGATLASSGFDRLICKILIITLVQVACGCSLSLIIVFSIFVCCSDVECLWRLWKLCNPKGPQWRSDGAALQHRRQVSVNLFSLNVNVSFNDIINFIIHSVFFLCPSACFFQRAQTRPWVCGTVKQVRGSSVWKGTRPLWTPAIQPVADPSSSAQAVMMEQ